jgi:hypothetical protein
MRRYGAREQDASQNLAALACCGGAAHVGRSTLSR